MINRFETKIHLHDVYSTYLSNNPTNLLHIEDDLWYPNYSKHG